MIVRLLLFVVNFTRTLMSHKKTHGRKCCKACTDQSYKRNIGFKGSDHEVLPWDHNHIAHFIINNQSPLISPGQTERRDQRRVRQQPDATAHAQSVEATRRPFGRDDHIGRLQRHLQRCVVSLT